MSSKKRSRAKYVASERQLMDALIEAAHRMHFQVAHIPDSLYALAASQGRYDALVGAKGLPDLIICGYGTLLVIETKDESNALEPEQQAWLAAFEQIDHDRVHVMLARPEDQDAIIDLMVKYREESWSAT